MQSMDNGPMFGNPFGGSPQKAPTEGGFNVDDLVKKIDAKIAELEAKIPEYLESFKVLSFDNLALEQLNIKKYVSPEDWKAHYMGDDGSFTMYIDLVKEEFAKNSTSVDRYNLNDYKSIEEIFNKIKN